MAAKSWGTETKVRRRRARAVLAPAAGAGEPDGSMMEGGRRGGCHPKEKKERKESSRRLRREDGA